jgi:hypothetical protein
MFAGNSGIKVQRPLRRLLYFVFTRFLLLFWRHSFANLIPDQLLAASNRTRHTEDDLAAWIFIYLFIFGGGLRPVVVVALSIFGVIYVSVVRVIYVAVMHKLSHIMTRIKSADALELASSARQSQRMRLGVA